MEASEELKQIQWSLGRVGSTVVVEQSPTVQLRYNKAENSKNNLMLLLLLLLFMKVLQSMSQLVVIDVYCAILIRFKILHLHDIIK